jgi:hypothetical protein
MASKILFYFILVLNFSLLFSFKCGHDLIKQIPKILNDSTTTNNSTRRLDSYHSISFFVDYTQMDSDSTTLEYKNFIKQSINSSLKVFSELLKVKRSDKLAITNPEYCGRGKITVYDQSIKNGVDKDIILVPIIDRTLPDGVDAAASVCYLSPSDQRPIMGYISLNDNYNYNKVNAQKFLTMLLIHEISHVLVFSDGLYDYFKSGDVTINKTINGVSRTLIQTPKVKEVASKHFGCSSVVGVEL